MNIIHFELSPTTTYPPDMGVGIWIDGESLIDRICKLEGPWWETRGTPQPQGQYVWVPARIALLPALHLLGEPADSWFGEFSPVLVCRCGEPVCRCYAVRVEVSRYRIEWKTWREFPPEEARLGDALPPLRFERLRYYEGLLRVSGQYRRTYRRGDSSSASGSL